MIWLEKIRSKLNRQHLLDWIYPRHCIACMSSLTQNAWHVLCESCANEIVPIKDPQCRVCGKPFYGNVSGSQICPKCIEAPPVFDKAYALLQMRQTGRKIVHVLKYRRGHYTLPDIAKITANRPDFLEKLSGAILVPVPLYPIKQFLRGYNQSTCLAELWASLAKNAQVAHLLKRTRHTPSQITLSREERSRNVKNAFSIRSKSGIPPGMKYVIIDDVFTTGSTVNACAIVLKKAGAKHVEVATLCHD
jgi:competence protein ComFC